MDLKKFFFLQGLIFALFSQAVKGKPEKITYFLMKHEVVKIPEVKNLHNTLPKMLKVKASDSEMVIDLQLYYSREDAVISFISKFKNSTTTFFQTDWKYDLYYGTVRGIKGSFVYGYFVNGYFRGYVVTDKVFCVEPYVPKGSSLVYQFTDIMIPGCQSLDGKTLDCSAIKYFQPWKRNRPPQPPKTNKYSLFEKKFGTLYNRYVELFEKLKTHSHHEKHKGEANDKHIREHSNHTNRHDDAYMSQTDNRTHESGNKKDKGKHHDDQSKSIIFQNNEHKTENPNDMSIFKKNNQSKNIKTKTTKTGKLHPSSIISSESVIESFQVERLEDSMSPSNLNLDSNNRKTLDDWGFQNIERLEETPEEFQCNLEIAIDSSYRTRFGGGPENAIKDIYTHLSLLNKIFRKVLLHMMEKKFHLTFTIQQITVYMDDVYSPFSEDTDLAYFTQKHQQQIRNCLTIGLVNKVLPSGQFYDGYIPRSGGGICSKTGNTLILSHGNRDTPIPMGLFFSSLIRSVTRAFGANDDDAECNEGSVPNPMNILTMNILKVDIKSDKKLAIFNECNLKEMSSAISNADCLMRIVDPLCGDAILDVGESCDCGPSYLCNSIDRCCNYPVLYPSVKGKDDHSSRGCRLLKGVQCSDKVDDCCSGCRIEQKKRSCRSGVGVCDASFCDGKSAKCPTGPEASYGIICESPKNRTTDPLYCKNMKCDQPLCESFKLQPCSCLPLTENECSYCCMKDGECKTAGKELKLMTSPNNLEKADGDECVGGICMYGKCQLHNEKQMVNITDIIPVEGDKENSGSELHCTLWIIRMAFMFISFRLLL